MSFDISLPGMRPDAMDLTNDSTSYRHPEVRVYQFGPGSLCLQLRSLGSITPSFARKGKERLMVSDVHLDAQQARRLAGLLVKWADQQKKGN